MIRVRIEVDVPQGGEINVTTESIVYRGDAVATLDSLVVAAQAQVKAALQAHA